jgi:hypothetical protein
MATPFYPISIGRAGRPQARVGRQVYDYTGCLAVLQPGSPKATLYARWTSRCPCCGCSYTYVARHFAPRQHGCWPSLHRREA